MLLSANEVGLLLLDYVCGRRARHGRMPERPVFAKTIVTIDLAERVAERYGARTIDVLTGFKLVGEVIGRLEAEGRERDFVCAFEESYGYLTGTYVRDKDGVNAALMICEMFAFHRTRGVSLLERLEELYGRYGHCLNTLHSYEFPGSAGTGRMGSIMADLRGGARFGRRREGAAHGGLLRRPRRPAEVGRAEVPHPVRLRRGQALRHGAEAEGVRQRHGGRPRRGGRARAQDRGGAGGEGEVRRIAAGLEARVKAAAS